MTNAALWGKSDAGNTHVQFDEGEVASCTEEASLRRVSCRRQPEGRASGCAATPRRGSLLYKNAIKAVAAVAAFVFALMAYGETWCYNVINGNEAELCCGRNCPAVAPEPTGALVVRSSINGYPVTSIGDRSFNNCWYMTSATLPDSVRNIGPSAFARCSALETVGGIENVTNIGNYAFYNCTSLKNIALGGNLKTIGQQAFRNCTRLTSVEVPDSVTSLDDYAFYSCEGLRTIKLGSKLKTIGQQAFRNCIGLTDVEVPDSVTSIGDYAFYGCSNLVHLSLPSRFDGLCSRT